MPRIKTIQPGQTAGQTRELLAGVQKALGRIPNMMRTMAHSEAVLEGYLRFSGALDGGRLSAALRNKIALAVAEINACRYCLAVHTDQGRSMGMKTDDLLASRRLASDDPKDEAAIQFAYQIVMARGEVSDRVLARVRRAGFSDGEIAEIIANVALSIFTNYFNKVAGVAIDFPAAGSL